MSKDDPVPTPVYQLSMTVDGNDLDSLLAELDHFSERIQQGSTNVVSGRGYFKLTHNEGQTPENYKREIKEWCKRHRESREATP